MGSRPADMQILPKKMVVLEKRQRLSHSILWKLQRDFFEGQGIDAWTAGTVPHHITSNNFIAETYAKIVFGFLRDLLSPGKTGNDESVPTFNPNEPVFIVELGSGPGRFGYLFLKNLLLKCESLQRHISIKYVLTDYSEPTVGYWLDHPRLQPLVQKGVLDFACFDVEHDHKLKLVHSGQTVSARSLGNPLIVIANYLFDSIPQDAFFVSRGRLFETLVNLSMPERDKYLEDPDTLSRLEVSYDHHRVNGSYYRDAKWNRILDDYRRRLSETSFLFPTAALQCIKKLHRLSRGRMFLVSGDRGYSGDEGLLQDQGGPTMAVHGSISMLVDYQIIGEYCRSLGGQVLHPGRRTENLNISAFLFGDGNSFRKTRGAYAEVIEKFGPDDFFNLKEGLVPSRDTLTHDQTLAFLRLSCWDFKRFWECIPAFKRRLADLNESQKRELYEVILLVWDRYFPIGEENDLAFEMGTLLLEMDFYAEALGFLQQSVDLYGMAPGTAYNLCVCYYQLGQLGQALEYVSHALDLDPEFVEAQALRAELVSTIPGTARKTRRKRQA